MTQKEAKKYIKKIGLENAHNGLKRITTMSDTFSFSSDFQLLSYAYSILKNFLSNYDSTYRATVYIYRYDGTFNFLYNDSKGIVGTPERVALDFIQEYAKEHSSTENYILLIETKPNTISIVTQL